MQQDYFAALTSSAVSCAIISSSLVGMTQTVTLESSAEMMASLPRVLDQIRRTAPRAYKMYHFYPSLI